MRTENTPPTCGAQMIINGKAYIVRRVYRAGTCDVESVETGRWFRVTGLSWR